MIIRINKSKTLTKHISCECEFDSKKCNSKQMWNNDLSVLMIISRILVMLIKLVNIWKVELMIQ